jgi:hypothetical protein
MPNKIMVKALCDLPLFPRMKAGECRDISAYEAHLLIALGWVTTVITEQPKRGPGRPKKAV